MKDLSIYFKPCELNEVLDSEKIADKIISHTEASFPEMSKNNIALIFCPEYRSAHDETAMDEDVFSTFLDGFSKLSYGENWNFTIYNLGIIRPGNELKDTHFALSQVVSELVKHEILPIVIGGTQDLTFALYQAYQHLEQMVNLTCIDKQFDLGKPDEDLAPDGFISSILMQRPCYLFNVSYIGVQAPFVKKTEMDLFEKLYFDVCRLGEFNADFKIAEPYLRNTDILSLDMNAIRWADFSNSGSSPNGFQADQVCQLAKYAGISDKLAVFGIFSIDDFSVKNCALLGEILWYFLDGFSQRKGDFPIGTKKEYTKFVVHFDEHDDITFYKSPKSNRWWMEVPYPNTSGVKFERHHMVPCNYEDYMAAMENEIPNLWWKTFQKLI